MDPSDLNILKVDSNVMGRKAYDIAKFNFFQTVFKSKTYCHKSNYIYRKVTHFQLSSLNLCVGGINICYHFILK